MAGDTLFYAGLAGARQDRIDRLKRYNRELQGYVDSLDAQVQQLNQALQSWQEEAVEGRASAGVALKAFKEVTGKTVREHFGDAETDRRVALEREDYKKFQGLR
ncbi:hypothetical protein SAMN05421721_10639 [Ectothiorhodospira mobilis]|uniref:Uncharacterized protein n=1 Tax=Ectothiorhodospira mobilis TaxID=195064 RepID=A0A1I4R100_ECTMO|nr:hypothetical protein [Ectothiorhodospira mobilis]SFM45613.1 hypothetical protein SAMN05421721_10639 [Ectothiorhodospira mobilis]